MRSLYVSVALTLILASLIILFPALSALSTLFAGDAYDTSERFLWVLGVGGTAFAVVGIAAAVVILARANRRF
jgi:hypothetical protein